MESITAQIQTLAEKSDAVGRSSLQSQLRDVLYRLESPTDTFFRLYSAHLQVAAVYVGVQLGLFRELAKENVGVLTTVQLSEMSGASPELLERILRYLSASGYVTNTGPSQFRANKLSHTLSDPLADAGLRHCFDTCGPAVQAFPSFLEETKFRDITDNKSTPFQKGFNTDLDCFQWLAQQPKQFGAMQKIMSAMQSSEWLDGLEVLDQRASQVSQASNSEESAEGQAVPRPFFVDVGGGHGHQCKAIRDKYPNLHGRLVLQDLPEAVDELPPIDGVEAMAHDFFKEQPVKDARFYYMRRILHDWPDQLCIEILSHLASAMSAGVEGSRILIDEIVLPDVNAPWQAAMGDLSMGILFGGKERTRSQWEALVAAVPETSSGHRLRIDQVHTYSSSMCSSVTVLELHGRE